MTLQVDPTQLPVAGSQFEVTGETLMGVVSGATTAMVPPPPGMDPTSGILAGFVAGWGLGTVTPVVTDAIKKLSDGAQVLVPIAGSYQGSDAQGGNAIRAALV